MKITTNIKSKVKPDTKEFTDNAVYVRKNINTYIDNDPVFNTSVVMYTYDEYSYTIAEWLELTDNRQFNVLSALIDKGLVDESVFELLTDDIE